ncbi:MAG TPA: NADH-quinone oxidoreductase subunit N, partial [bacterium]|nr:NADH-quinone oxidoreductase subunit N [bacterium]
LHNLESIQTYFSSELVLFLGIVLLLWASVNKKQDRARTCAILAVSVLAFSLVAGVFTHFSQELLLFHGLVALDAFGQFFKIIITFTAIIVVVLATRSNDLDGSPKPEFYALLITLTLGLTILSTANHLLMIYLAVEMSSLVSYVLAGYITENTRSDEAGLKYVLYGGVASAVMLFGMSLLYGVTGEMGLVSIREFLISHPVDPMILFLAVIMIFAGLGYKMAVVPFHMWSPDVYEGAPLPVTAYLSVASKAGGFAVTLRFFLVGFVGASSKDLWMALGGIDWPLLIALLSATTMTVGNLLALHQQNIKRFLAYSSIAHAGYLLMGLVAVSRAGVEAVLYYFAIYFLMNLGAFVVAQVLVNQGKTENMEDYRGLVRQGPFGVFLSLSLTVFLFSLAGIPPFAGFVAKWYVFKAVIDSGYLWLAIVAVINSVVALYYYVRLIKFMLIDETQTVLVLKNTHWRYAGIIFIFASLVLLFGVYFSPIVKWAQVSAVMYY